MKEDSRRNRIRHWSRLPVSVRADRWLGTGRHDTIIWYVSTRHAVRRRQPSSDIWLEHLPQCDCYACTAWLAHFWYVVIYVGVYNNVSNGVIVCRCTYRFYQVLSFTKSNCVTLPMTRCPQFTRPPGSIHWIIGFERNAGVLSQAATEAQNSCWV